MSLRLHRPDRRCADPAAQRGLTLVESLLTTAVVATAAASAGPAISQWRTQQAVVQAAAAFETDVHLARSQALARHETLRLSFEDHAGGARCYVLHSGPRGACRCEPATGEARCRLQWSVNGGTCANIPQANVSSHTRAMDANYG